MRIRLGVIGPSDSISLVEKAAKDFDEIDLIPFPYKEMEETIKIILNNKHTVDQWFFSGQAPYFFSLSNGLIREEEGSFVPLNGQSLFKTLLESQLKEQKILKRISLDTIQELEIEEIQEVISPLQVYSFPYTGYLPAQDIINFHLKLFREGKIDVAITCIQTVYTHLNELGVPCYRVTPEIYAIRLMLQYLKKRAESHQYRKAQTAILGIELIHFSTDDHLYSYKMKHQELELKRVLLHFAEEMNGSFVQIGDGHFFIYTTRGETEFRLNDNTLFELIEEIRLHSKLQIRMGLGYGITALDAEQNVRKALQYARKQDTPTVVIVDDDKKVTEFAGTLEKISYSGRAWDGEWDDKLKSASISPTIISKIQSHAFHYKKTQITSTELAHWLKSTERNARRILFELEQLNLVSVIGEEQSGTRGRPRKIYELKIHTHETLPL